MKRTWIKVKSGLLTPEHVERIGPRIWLFLYMLDRADWPTGTISGWTDKDAGDALGMSEGTVRDQRRLLARDGYVVCRRKFQASQVLVVKWVNPREYTGQVYNQPGVAVPEPSHTGEITPVSINDEDPHTGVHTGEHTGDSPRDSSLGSHTTLHTRTRTVGTPKKQRAPDPLFDAVAEICSVDPKTAGPSLGSVVATLREAGYSPAEVLAFKAWWDSDEWRRQHPPTMWKLKEQIRYVRTPEGKKFLKRDPRALPEPTAAPVFIPPHSRFKCPTCSGYLDQHPDGCPYAQEAKP